MNALRDYYRNESPWDVAEPMAAAEVDERAPSRASTKAELLAAAARRLREFNLSNPDFYRNCRLPARPNRAPRPRTQWRMIIRTSDEAYAPAPLDRLRRVLALHGAGSKQFTLAERRYKKSLS
jgi:hypothetical protein